MKTNSIVAKKTNLNIKGNLKEKKLSPKTNSDNLINRFIEFIRKNYKLIIDIISILVGIAGILFGYYNLNQNVALKEKKNELNNNIDSIKKVTNNDIKWYDDNLRKLDNKANIKNPLDNGIYPYNPNIPNKNITGTLNNKVENIGKIIDDSGNPIFGVIISSKKGPTTFTGKDGYFKIKSNPNDTLYLNKKGYKINKIIFKKGNRKVKEIILEKL